MKTHPSIVSFCDDMLPKGSSGHFHFHKEGDKIFEEAYYRQSGVSGVDGGRTLRSANHPNKVHYHPEPTGALRETLIARLNELRPLAKQLLG